MCGIATQIEYYSIIKKGQTTTKHTHTHNLKSIILKEITLEGLHTLQVHFVGNSEKDESDLHQQNRSVVAWGWDGQRVYWQNRLQDFQGPGQNGNREPLVQKVKNFKAVAPEPLSKCRAPLSTSPHVSTLLAHP